MVPGYGWIFPLGDGRVNVGVGLLSTDRRWKGVNTGDPDGALRGLGPRGVGAVAGDLPRSAHRGEAAHGPVGRAPARGHHPGGGRRRRVPSTRSTARASPTATRRAGWPPRRSARPCPATGTPPWLRYEDRLEDAYGLYYRVARAFIRVIANPELMKLCVGTGMHSETLMEWILRIMANLVRPDEIGSGRGRLPGPVRHRPPGPRRSLTGGRPPTTVTRRGRPPGRLRR